MADGRLRFVETHILADELHPPNPMDLKRLDALRQELEGDDVPTRGFVLGVSRLDHAALFSDDDRDRFDSLAVQNPRNAEDALLAHTADGVGAILVTKDKKATRRATREGIEVEHPADLVERLRK